MKNFKKIASAIAALSLAACVAVPMSANLMANAAITITPATSDTATTHTYTAYKIFEGTLSGGTLTDVKWATAGNTINFLKAIQDIEVSGDPNPIKPFSGKNTAAEIAKVLSDAATGVYKESDVESKGDFRKQTMDMEITKKFADVVAANISAFTTQATATSGADNKYTIDVATTGAGYYLIQDSAAPSGTGSSNNGAMTRYILEVLDPSATLDITAKAAAPTVDKQVLDNDTAESITDKTGGTAYDASAGGVWGETADHAINESFQFKLTATLAADDNYDAYEKYTVRFSDVMSTGVTFDSIESVKLTCGTSSVSWSADDVSTKYTTDFTAWDSTPYDGNGTKAWTLTIDDLKNIDGFTWSTEQDVTIEVIYNAHLNAQAKANNASGATTNENTVGLQYSNNPNASGSGDDFEDNHGDTPKDSVWVFTYESDNSKVQPDTGESTKPLTGAVFELYKGNDTSGTLMKFYTEEIDGTTYYIPYDGTVTVEGKTGSSDVAANQGTGNNEFKFKGLDTGTYTLHEKTTPNGFNTCPDTTFTITATHKENGASDTTKNNVTLSAKNGEANYSLTNNTVLNQKGATLPSTGGIGTTLFYLGGGALVAVAGVMLITKKRMTKE